MMMEDKDYKSYVGLADRYDFMGASQFRLLTSLGLRSHHKLLDFGCGSLRAGKLLIPYLDTGNYYGQDPNEWLINDGIVNELGKEIENIKKPNFSNLDSFEIGFNEKFNFIIAQSIFSHTNIELTKKGLLSIFNSLTNDGIAVVTIIEGMNNYEGKEKWVYPGCTSYTPNTIKKLMVETGCFWRRISWFNPGYQTWYVITKTKSILPSIIDSFFLLGGEEVGSNQYKNQNCSFLL
jgi:hypothetical protein